MISTRLFVLVSLLSLTVAQEKYADCFTNYSVLEQAVLNTGDNRFEIIKAFYPPDSSFPSVYVTVMYVTEDESVHDTLIWTGVPIYLIHPANIFQFTSLLFSHHAFSNQVTSLTVKLPGACCNDTPSIPCSQCNNKYLEVLTKELYLYAQNNGRNTRITLDDTPSTSLRYGVGCSEIGQVAFFIFNISSIVLPFVLYILVWIIILSCRPRVRGLLAPSSISKNNTSQNYAAVILTGIVFSTYVVICDCFAIYNTFIDDVLDRYEEEGIHTLTIGSIITIAVLDISAFIVSCGVILHWSCIESCTCCHKRFYRENYFACGIRCFFAACLCRRVNVKIDTEGDAQYIQMQNPAANDDINKTIHVENKAWLLTASLLAPLVCFGTHVTFMMLAWSSDPDSSSSMTIVLTLSFLYYFFGFRQIYIAVASCLHKNHGCSCAFEIEEAATELSDHYESLRKFNFPAFLVTFFSGFLLVGIEVLLIMTYTNLPAPVTTIPSNILNILHLVLIIGSGLIAYKLLTIHTPHEEVILESLVSAYDKNDQNERNGQNGQNDRNGQNGQNVQTNSRSQDSAERVGTILGNALKTYYPPPAPPRGAGDGAGGVGDAGTGGAGGVGDASGAGGIGSASGPGGIGAGARSIGAGGIVGDAPPLNTSTR